MNDGNVSTWDLDRIFAGGPGGAAFRDALARSRDALEGLLRRASALGRLDGDGDAWAALFRDLEAASEDLSELCGHSSCAYSERTTSPEARAAYGATEELIALHGRVGVPIKAGLREADDRAMARFVGRPDLRDFAPMVRHLRAAGRLDLDRPLQELLAEIDREALHGWGQLYDLVSGVLKATIEIPGEPPRAVGIAALDPMLSKPDEALRRAAHDAGGRAWGEVRDICAMALTHITGARQTRLDRAGVDEIEPSLVGNRIAKRTLEAMEAAREEAGPILAAYLERKARILGKDRIDWWDQTAPASAGAEAPLSWAEACDLVRESFAGFSPDLGALVEKALRDRWIDAEPRDEKRQGAFCADFPRAAESRILMTFSGTLRSALTLAHELGHAYHNEILFRLPPARRRVTSALAETASTFGEAVVRDRVLARADSDAVRIRLLDQQLQAGVAYLMNIPARFRFERALYEMRRRGAFEADALSDRMVACQREAYGGALGSWNPLFWASKLHFYISHFGFYNWPYMFGYLFSSAVYARAREEGPAFAPKYDALLALTGYEETEAIGREIFGEDLAEPAFWRRAVRPLIAAGEAFLDATREAS
ncbi:MAG: hypothetical protein JXP34_16195 [Planctomycetes bacterium]|nr:hypothetical protein [Planctomycetota bacterium]